MSQIFNNVSKLMGSLGRDAFYWQSREELGFQSGLTRDEPKAVCSLVQTPEAEENGESKSPGIHRSERESSQLLVSLSIEV